jgi:AraC-like DNA-binding protein
MVTGFQKSANRLQELQLPHPGIINSEDFAAHFALRCYEPSPDLQPFVTHIWTQRTKQPFDPGLKPPIEIVSGPNVYLFFTAESAFIHGVTKTFEYDPFASVVIAGVKFKPGGFYPFLQRPIAELHVAAPSVASVFPAADEMFREKLLVQPDDSIVKMLENLLRSSSPQEDKNLDVITEILSALASDSSLRTVSATAQAFGMSERSLQLLFRTHVGVGVKWIITRRRLLQAISRSQSKPRPTWVEVATELGYSSQSHFSREFKEVTGMAPSEYIKALAN